MIRRQSMIALGVAVVLGLFAVFFANFYISGSEQTGRRCTGTTKVAVAAVPMAYGTDITPDKVRFVDYPNAACRREPSPAPPQLLPAGKKRVALLPIGVNEPILASKISGEGQGASIAALASRRHARRDGPHQRRFGRRRLRPAQRQRRRADHPHRRRAATEQQLTDVLLQNVRVIAIDQEAKNADGTPEGRADRDARGHSDRRPEARAGAAGREPQPGAAQAGRSRTIRSSRPSA